MARGSKAKYTDKQKRKAEHIEEGYEKSGKSHKEAERRLGYRQRDGQGRQETRRLRPRQEGQQGAGQEGRKTRR
jgi:hypothetical protein